MIRKTLLTMGLSLVVGLGAGTTLPYVSAGQPGGQIQLARWGDGGGEPGEIESPRWGDTGTEGGTESPRAGDQTTDGGDIQAPRGQAPQEQAPRWGDAEQGEVESPRG